MAENLTGYRELLCVLETTVELGGWFDNYGQHIYNRCEEIEEIIIPKITRPPIDLDRPRHKLADEIQERHGHMSIYAAEAAAEYWMNQ
ncbi:hypothetical protein DJ70_02965 [Halorubrum halodurans]|uniref:Uncharacterized protein n=2 Tax=Halorubrum halodurans TaxID=1383851 RepID=A0A256IPP0_9EURY|nr:hypothetical protein DJ70_02965 [Halorubrum halodurans]